jgi:2'-hydroxyisoflavone reductase
MRLLVIGGGRFLGRHLVAHALARGDTVTVFNRGRSGAVPDGVEQRVGNRRADLSALAQGQWDAVVDTCGYLPGEVERMAACLHGRVGAYAFVSSVSVYASTALANDESGAVGVIEDPGTEVVDGRTYGPLKALCEQAVQRRFGADALLLRPGLIVGPHDPTQRFTYWPARLARAVDGEPMLAPGRPDAPVQVIDVRDLAAFVLHALDSGARGIFNTVGADTTMGAVLQACAEVCGVRPDWRWVDMATLQARGLQPWRDLPLALPDDAEHAGFMRVDGRRARGAGLHTRALHDTVADTLAWWEGLPAAQQGFDQAGLSPAQEARALAPT